MKKFSFMILVLGIAIGATSYAYAQNSLLIGYNHDLVPSFYWLDKNSHQGIDAEIIKELFRRSELDYHIRFAPWKRLMHELKKGTIPIACPGFKTSERETFAIYLERPLNYAVFSIFVRQGEEFPYKGLRDLHGKKVGINRGYSISPALNAPEHQGKIMVEEANDAEGNLRKLIAKRTDVYAGNRDAVLFTAKNMGIPDKIAPLPHPITEPRPVYLMVSKTAQIDNKAEMVRKLGQKLDEMWQDGTVEGIVSKHIKLKSYINK